MPEITGSNDCFSQGAIPPDLTVPQDPNEYIQQLREQLAQVTQERDTWMKRYDTLWANHSTLHEDHAYQLTAKDQRIAELEKALEDTTFLVLEPHELRQQLATAQARITRLEEAYTPLCESAHHSESCGRGHTLQRDNLGCRCGLWDAIEQVQRTLAEEP